MPGSILTALTEQDFGKVTEWVLRDGKLKLASLDWPENSGWLYAFVIDDTDAMYIGLTERVLRSRMDNYRDNPGDQNQRIRELILTELNRGRMVSIYGLKEPDYARLHAEEERLTRKLKPTWNLK